MPRRVGQKQEIDLAAIRRLEAAALRAWPAETVSYDGTWVVRLTAGHPSKRLNSVNPLDPGDDRDVPGRVMRAVRRFEAFGRAPTFRVSPLSAPAISAFLDSEGWPELGRSLAMTLDLAESDLAGAMDQIPLQNRERFVEATLAVRGYEDRLRAGLARVIAAIRPESGLFVLEQDGEPVSVAMCVRDGILAGLFEIATRPDWRGRGYGRRVLLSALKWARAQGAERAWLQVEEDNEAALKLYRSLGFQKAYRYHYRQPAARGGGRPGT